MTQNLVICRFSKQRYVIINLCTFLGHPVLEENDHRHCNGSERDFDNVTYQAVMCMHCKGFL